MVINWIVNNSNCFLVRYDQCFVCCWVSFTTFARIPTFSQPNSYQNNFLVFSLLISLVQRGSSIAFGFWWKIWQLPNNIVAWSACDEIACQDNFWFWVLLFSFLLIRKIRHTKMEYVSYYSLQIQIISLYCTHSWTETAKVSFSLFAACRKRHAKPLYGHNDCESTFYVHNFP